jgi:large subunit ribosomal protein L30
MPEKDKKTTAKKKKTVKKKAAKSTRSKAASTKTKAATAGDTAAAPADASKVEKKTAPKPASARRLRVRQIRSTIRRQKTFQLTLKALGLRHHQDETIVTDSPSTRGMLRKVEHLVVVTPEE